jgi:hypothetical protein
MKKLNPEKLFVEFRPGVTPTEPIVPRRYSLTHSDITAELFLVVDQEYAYDKVNIMRDEVLAEWRTHNGGLFLYAAVFVGNYGPILSAIRNTIFRRELPLALEAIIYGDRRFFIEHPLLKNAPIWIQFDADDPKYNSLEYWGTPNDFVQK